MNESRVEIPSENTPEFEALCKAVHDAWWEEKKRQGITDHLDMIPYADLSEEKKEYDRATVRTVLDALRRVR